MRLGTGFLASVGISMTIAFGAVSPAAAWDRDLIYADSFGNLVIESAAGYKRIVVGQGHEAARLQKLSDAGQPENTYHEPDAYDAQDVVAVQDECYRPPVLVKGRSYMFGFDQGEIPLQGGRCR